MPLDIHTPLGADAIAQEELAIEIFHRYQASHGYTFKHTDKTKPVLFDGYIMNGETVRAIVESKCRYDTDYQEFRDRRKNVWLITESKLLRCCEIAASMNVPLYGFLYFVKCKTLLVMELADRRGRPREYKRAKTESKATINGGTASRWNALINMDNARVWR